MASLDHRLLLLIRPIHASFVSDGSSLARCTISFPECIAALDAALAGLIPRLEEGHPRLRIVMLANNEIVMK